MFLHPVLADDCYESIMEVAIEERHLMYDILLIGNDSRVPGIAAEFESKLEALRGTPITVNLPSDYELTVWKSARFMSNMAYALAMNFDQAQYAKYGINTRRAE